MDDLNAVAGEVANRMLGGGTQNRRSRLFADLKEMALQALRYTHSGLQRSPSVSQQRRPSSTRVGDIRGLWRVTSF